MKLAIQQISAEALVLSVALLGFVSTSCSTGTEEDTGYPTGNGGGGEETPSSGGASPQRGAGGSTNDSRNNDDLGAGGEGGSPPEQTPIYAHVTAVVVSGSAPDYNLSVSIESSDVDCTQFANWWEVLSEEGTLLYRRILTHSHTDENGTSDADAPGNTFTRSGGPIDLSSNQKVYVRAHMNTGGYNGAVMVGTMEEGFSVATDLVDDFAEAVESEEPQSARCDF